MLAASTYSPVRFLSDRHIVGNETVEVTLTVADDDHGLGVEIEENEGCLVVVGFRRHPVTGVPLPAEASGNVRVNDQWLAINDRKTVSVDDLRSILATEGADRKPVKLTLARASVDQVKPSPLPDRMTDVVRLEPSTPLGVLSRPLPTIADPIPAPPAAAAAAAPPSAPSAAPSSWMADAAIDPPTEVFTPPPPSPAFRQRRPPALTPADGDGNDAPPPHAATSSGSLRGATDSSAKAGMPPSAGARDKGGRAPSLLARSLSDVWGWASTSGKGAPSDTNGSPSPTRAPRPSPTKSTASSSLFAPVSPSPSRKSQTFTFVPPPLRAAWFGLRMGGAAVGATPQGQGPCSCCRPCDGDWACVHDDCGLTRDVDTDDDCCPPGDAATNTTTTSALAASRQEFAQQFRVMAWRNMKLRARGWVLLLLELLVPTVIIIALGGIKVILAPSSFP
jgi:hypothetical protein